MQAKSLIYGGDSCRPETPDYKGRKNVAHNTSIAAPFAMHDPAILEPGFRRPLQDAIRATNPRDNQAKVGADPWDPSTYMQNIADNQSGMEATKRRHRGHGNITAPGL
ncbi:MAG: hypothetical protein WDW38_001303 [Sanguina aurantia]